MEMESVMWLGCVLTAVVLAALSGVAGLLPPLPRALPLPWKAWKAWGGTGGERLAAGFMAAAALAGLAGAVGGLCGRGGSAAVFPWPAIGNGQVGLDALSAFFLVPVFLIGALGPVYGLGYWPERRHPGNGRRLRLFWGLLTAGMALLVVSRDALIFLMGWELMALSAFFLVTVEDHRAESRRAGWVYLLATHAGTLALFGLFALWRRMTGSTLFAPCGDAAWTGLHSLCFILAFLGFGLKAGVMPLHFWLPGAHANAPSHVSAMMSGVMLKMGVYGLVRWCSLLPDPPPAWGGLVLALGAVSAVLGVVFAIGQHDLKRLLAYHSVENIGIILMGLGLALIGRSTGHPEWTALGLAGCLLHVWNHSLFKALLFLCAGAVLHETGTRQLDRLGGLAKRLPWTAGCFLVGAVAICGLPPLNGFVSEWLVYLGLMGGAAAGGWGAAAALGAPVLAMTGALAVACFVKVYGVVFLGEARRPARGGARRREASALPVEPQVMRVPMAALAACCVLIGVAPALAVPALDAAAGCWLASAGGGAARLGGLAPFWVLSVLAAALLACGAGLWRCVGRTRRSVVPTWDCGYACPTARMQYTAGSFARTLVLFFSGVLRPRERPPQIVGLFPPPSRMHSHVDEAVLDRVLLPAGRRVEEWFAWFHRFQRGLTQHYVLYILLTLLAFLCSLFPFRQIVAHWFTR
jgi:hydrogenase-4 component B